MAATFLELSLGFANWLPVSFLFFLLILPVDAESCRSMPGVIFCLFNPLSFRTNVKVKLAQIQKSEIMLS